MTEGGDDDVDLGGPILGLRPQRPPLQPATPSSNGSPLPR